MILFLLLVFPLAFALYYYFNAENRGKQIICGFSGLFIGAAVCTYIGLFSSVYHLSSASFIKEALYVFFMQIALPVVLVFLLLWIVVRKDSFAELMKVFFPYFAGFYAVFLPFYILQHKLPYPFFMLFMKPLLFLAMIYAIPHYFQEILSRTQRKERGIVIALLVLVLFFPALTEGVWTVTANGWLCLLMCILSFALSALPFYYKPLLEKISA